MRGASWLLRPARQSSMWVAAALLGLCLLAFGAHVSCLPSGSISYEEGLSAYRAGLDLPGILSGRVVPPGLTDADPQPPLYFLLLAACTRLAGESDLALHFPSVAWAVLLVPLQYAAATRLWNRRAGLIAALFAALSPLYFRYGQEVRLFTMVAALGLLAVYALARGLQEGRYRWLAVALLATLAAACTSDIALALLPVLALQMAAAWPMSRRWRLATLAGTAALSVLVLVAVGLPLYPAPAATLARWRLAYPQALRDWLYASAGMPDFVRPAASAAGLLSLLLFLAGVLWPAASRSRLFLASYVVGPLLAIGVASLAQPDVGWEQYLLFASPALYLGVARGLERSSRVWPVGLAAGLVLAASMGYQTQRSLAAAPQTGRGYQDTAQAIYRGERPRDVIVTADAESVVRLLHYYRGRLPAIPLDSTLRARPQDENALRQAVADLAARFERIWLVEPGEPSSESTAEEWLSENAFPVESQFLPAGGGEVRLDLYLTRLPELAELPPRQHSLQVDLGSLRLEGYDLPLRPAAGGERAWVTLYWRTLQAKDVEVSLRLVDEQGWEWANSRQVPYPAFPPSHWSPGTVMRQEASLAVPAGVPPGWYRLVLRLYDPESGRPIEPISGAQPGPLSLGQLLVEATWAGHAGLDAVAGVAQALPGGMRFGESLALRAFRVDTPSVAPGQWLRTSLYWSVQRPPQDMTLAMELVDPHGTVVRSRTASPVTPTYPAADWRQGELLWGQHELLVPTTALPGTYSLRLSMLDATGRRMPIRNQWYFWSWGNDAAVLSTVQVVAPARDTPAPPMEQALDALSTGGIDLLGFDGVPQRVRAGETMSVTLHWRAAVVPTRSYKVSVQLLGGDRRTVLAQDDSVPVAWSRPTTGWRLGEVVSDLHEVTIPASTAPQSATLIAALYDQDTGRRVEWLLDGQLAESVVLCQVDVER